MCSLVLFCSGFGFFFSLSKVGSYCFSVGPSEIFPFHGNKTMKCCISPLTLVCTAFRPDWRNICFYWLVHCIVLGRQISIQSVSLNLFLNSKFWIIFAHLFVYTPDTLHICRTYLLYISLKTSNAISISSVELMKLTLMPMSGGGWWHSMECKCVVMACSCDMADGAFHPTTEQQMAANVTEHEARKALAWVFQQIACKRWK